MPFLFTNAFLLAALAALGIPVLIHLLLKRKNQRLRFSTIRFFVRQDEQASSRRKLRNLLLLALRLLILALIVFAFARPYLPLPSAAAAARQRQQVVLVLDRSLSLQATDTGGRRWNKVQQIAREQLAKLTPDDRAALVLSDSKATVVSGLAQPSVVAQHITGLTPGSSSADLAGGLREAVRLIAHSDSRMASTIVFISDLQRSGVDNLESVRIPAAVETQWIPVGDLAAPNIAVAELNLEPSEAAAPHAVVVNHSEEDLSALETQLVVDGKTMLARTIALKAGTATNLNLAIPSLKPGWHDVEFRVRPSDALAADDVRFQTLFVPEPIRVLLIEGRPRARSFEEQSFFIGAALDPAFGTTNANTARFMLKKLGPAELTGALPIPGVVVIPAQKAISSEARRTLAEFVRAGGGVLLFVGEEISANGFNNDFVELSPASLKILERAESDLPWRIGDFDRTSPLFAPFRQANSGNLALPQFTARFTVAAPEKAVVLARFDDGVPLLVSGRFGTGRVLLVNSSADTSWNDWPKHKTFVPALHQMVQFLAGKADEAAFSAGTNLVAGTEVELELGRSAQNARLRLVGPAKQTINLTTDAEGRIDLKNLQPGGWSFRDSADRELQRLSVNVPASEADLAALRPSDVQQLMVREQPEESAGLSENLFGPTPGQRELWRVLILGALGLLLIETLFSNRSYA